MLLGFLVFGILGILGAVVASAAQKNSQSAALSEEERTRWKLLNTLGRVAASIGGLIAIILLNLAIFHPLSVALIVLIVLTLIVLLPSLIVAGGMVFLIELVASESGAKHNLPWPFTAVFWAYILGSIGVIVLAMNPF